MVRSLLADGAKTVTEPASISTSAVKSANQFWNTSAGQPRLSSSIHCDQNSDIAIQKKKLPVRNLLILRKGTASASFEILNLREE